MSCANACVEKTMHALWIPTRSRTVDVVRPVAKAVQRLVGDADRVPNGRRLHNTTREEDGLIEGLLQEALALREALEDHAGN